MRIVVNDIAASTGGAMSILKDFYTFIKANDSDNTWIFLLGDRYLEEDGNIKIIALPKVKKNWWRKLAFDFITGKKLIRSLHPDVVFSMQNIITFGLKIPQVVYVHQPLPFQSVKNFSFFKSNERVLAVYQHLIGFIVKFSIRTADKVIVQTRWMKKAVCAKVSINESKTVNILPQVEDLGDYKKNIAFDNTSFFYPTANSEYKNNSCIYQACNLLNQCGIHNFNVKMTIHDERNQANVLFVGRIAREQVFEEYNRSTLVFPSYIETFGFPLAEARQMGTIILASDCEFSREVLDGYKNAYFFNPFKPKELAELMKKVITGEIKKPDLFSDYYLEKQINSWEKVKRIVTEVGK